MYKIINLHNRDYIVKEQEKHRAGDYPQANFLGSGMCLCGVLNKQETLEQWEVRTNKVKLKTKKNDCRSKTRRNDSVGKPVRQRKKHLTAVS